MDLEKKILSDVTVHMKYARYLEDYNRREKYAVWRQANRGLS